MAIARVQAWLIVCWTTHDETGKELARYEFLDELHQQGLLLTAVAVAVAPSALAAARQAELASPRCPMPRCWPTSP